MIDLDGRIGDELRRICLLAAPNEAAGVIMGTRVVELENHAEDPTTAFQIHKDDLVKKLGMKPPGLGVEEIIIWHSHPGGGIGPSRIDLQNKTGFKYHLVLTLLDGEMVPTWY